MKERCDVCGWPLAKDPKDGCVEGNCSQRPRPKPTYMEPTQLDRIESAVALMAAQVKQLVDWVEVARRAKGEA